MERIFRSADGQQVHVVPEVAAEMFDHVENLVIVGNTDFYEDHDFLLGFYGVYGQELTPAPINRVHELAQLLEQAYSLPKLKENYLDHIGDDTHDVCNRIQEHLETMVGRKVDRESVLEVHDLVKDLYPEHTQTYTAHWLGPDRLVIATLPFGEYEEEVPLQEWTLLDKWLLRHNFEHSVKDFSDQDTSTTCYVNCSDSGLYMELEEWMARKAVPDLF